MKDKIYLSGFQLKTISIRPSIDPNTKGWFGIDESAILGWAYIGEDEK